MADVNWFSTHLQSLMNSLHISAKTVPIFLTDNVLLYIGHGNYTNCCILGYHGAAIPVGQGSGSANGQGKQPVQTFMYGAWTTPGTYSGFLSDYTGTRTAPVPTRGLADIHGLSHEVSEWLDDPFVNNAVQPWLTPTAPQYGCTNVLETGDPVVGIGFAIGTNTFAQGPNPNGTQSADGYYHPEDEALLPWFMRLPSSNTGTEVNQSGVGGRYTFMGDLNPFPGFRQPATGC